ncbi:hypothetical protein [Mucilaginibacter sp.]|uniref:hypothetical protein n=1 Tax=Mucilaginibacter sp. TaxID=1882438 RepID=UPI002615B09C|nr:hypothetical protein [Mucilaginibacter sp.]MDB5129873.1 hypothetical protein [Mucilaginibacter sp.]
MYTLTELEEYFYLKGLTFNRDEIMALLPAIASGDLGPALPTTIPSELVAGKSYSFTQSGTYENFLDQSGNPIVIPEPADNEVIMNGRLYSNGTYWIPSYSVPTLPTTTVAAGSVTPGKTSFVLPKKNLFNLADPGVVLGSLINYVTSLPNANASYNVTAPIPVIGSTSYTMSYKTHFCWYDSNHAFISGETSTGVANYNVVSPVNAAYFRSSVQVSKWPTWQFEAGGVATAFERFTYMVHATDNIPFDFASYLPAIKDDLTSINPTEVLSAKQGKVLNDKIAAVGIVNPWAVYAGANTANELLIKAAVKKIALAGPGIVPAKTYYLARMAYKLTTGVNDIYFRIQDQDGVIVAFYQFASTAGDVGLKEYTFTYTGNTAKITIDWTNIPLNFTYITGTNVTMQLSAGAYVFSNLFIGAKVTGVLPATAAGDAVNYEQFLAASNPIQLKQTKNSYKRVGDVLYIGAKWDDANDIIIKFALSMLNNLMTFNSVGLTANATKTPLLTADRSTTTILVSDSSDYIGPIQIDGVFVGGGHLQDESGITTAKNNSFSFFADGYEILDGDNFFADELVINVVNEIYNPNTLSAVVKDVNVIEKVTYKVKNGNIDIFLRHDFPIATHITTYYGMQSVGQLWQDKIYFSHSALPDVTDKVANVKSGARLAYPNVEKIILCNADKSICQSMFLDKTLGLGSKCSTNAFVTATDSLAFTTDKNKTYFRLISDARICAGEFRTWRGTYTWFKQLPLTNANTLFGFVVKRGNDTLVIADFKGASPNEKITVPEKYKLNDVNILQSNEGCNMELIVGPDGVDISTINAGTVVAKIS